MFGKSMRVEFDGFGITLRPIRKEEMGHLTELLNHHEAIAWTNMRSGLVLEGEQEWWERARSNSDGVLWGIVPDGEEAVIGTTGLHSLDQVSLSCSSGIVIANPEWHGKGVGTRAHLARTWYAVHILNRRTIESSVYEPNEKSRKALERVGYRATGRSRTKFLEGRYVTRVSFLWTSPHHAKDIYPEGVPQEMEESLEKARIALNRASQVVKFL